MKRHAWLAWLALSLQLLSGLGSNLHAASALASGQTIQICTPAGLVNLHPDNKSQTATEGYVNNSDSTQTKPCPFCTLAATLSLPSAKQLSFAHQALPGLSPMAAPTHALAPQPEQRHAPCRAPPLSLA